MYWKIVFDDGPLKDDEGWLKIPDGKVFDIDGNEITYGVSYHTIDTEASPPDWA